MTTCMLTAQTGIDSEAKSKDTCIIKEMKISSLLSSSSPSAGNE